MTDDRRSAETAVESLRKGIPPPGMIRRFTVGRTTELDTLEETLAHPRDNRGAALLIRANYGAGKSHLLKLVRELALDKGYVVASVTLDAHGGVRFNRMDTILGAICRTIEVPGSSHRGVGALFERFEATTEPPMDERVRVIRDRISEGGQWSFSETLGSAGLYVALRAWVNSAPNSTTRDLVADWLSFPDKYRTQRRALYEKLVTFSGRPFRDPRSDRDFYADQVFSLHTQGHHQAWESLRDFQLLAEVSRLKGVILLFDEFEDVIQNLNNRTYQQAAFLNLFRFFAGDRFPGMAYFAVTPEFVVKCKQELLSRQVYDFPFVRFDDLTHFEMSRIDENDFMRLAAVIRQVHGTAYEWDATSGVSDADLPAVVSQLFQQSTQDQTRQAIQGFVAVLDQRLEELG